MLSVSILIIISRIPQHGVDISLFQGFLENISSRAQIVHRIYLHQDKSCSLSTVIGTHPLSIPPVSILLSKLKKGTCRQRGLLTVTVPFKETRVVAPRATSDKNAQIE